MSRRERGAGLTSPRSQRPHLSRRFKSPTRNNVVLARRDRDDLLESERTLNQCDRLQQLTELAVIPQDADRLHDALRHGAGGFRANLKAGVRVEILDLLTPRFVDYTDLVCRPAVEIRARHCGEFADV